MARFNRNATRVRDKPNAVNLAGGTEAFIQEPKLELASLVLTSFVKDKFYRSETTELAKVKSLIAQVDPVFVAKLAVFARHKFGMRSISHILAAELGSADRGATWRKRFYNRIVRRVDDMGEIMALHGKPWPKAMKRGFALAIGRFTPYQLAKYRGEDKDVSLVDIVNICRPKPTERNGEALSQLVAGTLRSTDTWETQITAAGQGENKAAQTVGAWKGLLREKKLGYFALLRNVRNIIKQGDHELCELAMGALVNREEIVKSLVLPFRFQTAYDVIASMTGEWPRRFLPVLGEAAGLALDNVPRFSGRTLVVLDVSGSMEGKPATIGALFAAVLYKANDADLMTFSYGSKYVTPDPSMNVLALAKSIRFAGGGTNFVSIFETANQSYERAFVLSDMQGWMKTRTMYDSMATGSQALASLKEYRRKHGDVKVYSFDLNGYGTTQFPAHRLYCLTGWSEKVFDIVALLEKDRAALVATIEKVEL